MMTRDLDHLVETHRIARERRNAGLPVWKWRIKIKDLLSAEEDDGIAISAGREIGKRLRRGFPGLIDANNSAYDDDFDAIVYDLEHITTVAELNEVLDSLYDWADTNRLWLG